jgi:hypothetical protein
MAGGGLRLRGVFWMGGHGDGLETKSSGQPRDGPFNMHAKLTPFLTAVHWRHAVMSAQ